MTSVYEAVTFSKQEKCQEKDMNYQDIWYNYSVIVMNIFLVSSEHHISRVLTSLPLTIAQIPPYHCPL